MFKHEKQLFHPVSVERPNPQYAALLQEQLGGANGELKAAMQYLSQSFRIKDPIIKDLFLDIAAEELGHMEMVAQTINLLNGHDPPRITGMCIVVALITGSGMNPMPVIPITNSTPQSMASVAMYRVFIVLCFIFRYLLLPFLINKDTAQI